MRRSVSQSASLVAALLLCAAAGRAADDSAAASAVAAMGRGDFASAEQTLRTALQSLPNDARILSLLGVALDNQKKPREADEFHRRALAAAPRSADVLANYGNHLLGEGDEKGARDAYLKAVAVDPAHPNANLQLARLALNRKDAAEALADLKRLPASQQEAFSAAALRLQALYMAGDGSEAGALAGRLSTAAGSDPGRNFALGVALGTAEQYDKAEPYLARALEADPSNPSVLWRLGVAASRAGHNGRAREVLETLLRQEPQNVDVLYALAWADHELKRNEASVALLARAAQLAPRNADVQKLMAVVTSELRAWDDSLAAWERYLKLRPGDELARRERGFMLARLGKFDEGMVDLDWYIKRHPDDADGHFEIALAQVDVDKTVAMEHLNAALKLEPDYAAAHSARGNLYYQQGNPEAALPDLEFAAAHDPDNAVTLDRLGETYTALDRAADAVRVLRKAVELAPNDSKTQYHFAIALGLAGSAAEARAAMERFKQLGPTKVDTVPAGLVDYLSLTPEQQKADYRQRVEQAVAKDPSDVDAQLRYLRLSLEDGKTEQAAATARRIAALKPPPDRLADAGRALLESNQFALAKELLEQAEAAGPSADVELDLAIAAFHSEGAQAGIERMDRVPEAGRSGDYYLARAQMLDAAGKPEEAAAALNKALVAAPKRADLYRQAAAFLIGNGKAGEALKMLDRAAGNMPEDREILLAQAVVLDLAKQTGDSYKLLADIQARWPEWHAGWVALGIVLAAHGRSEEARHALETAVSLGARSPEAFYYLAASSLGSAPKRLDAAAAAIGRALQLSPDDASMQALAGRIAEETGDHAGAVDRLREAIRLDPGLAQAHKDLARAYTALGRQQDAQIEIERAKQGADGDPRYLIKLLQSRPPSDW